MANSSYIKPLTDNLTEISDKLERIGRQAILENMDQVIHTITELQWGQNLDSYGHKIGWYSPYTEEYANDPHRPARNPSTKKAHMPYNLEWTGELYETLAIKFDEDSFSIYSTTGKIKFLEQNLKDSFVRLSKLTRENNKLINDTIILPYLEKYILDHLTPRGFF